MPKIEDNSDLILFVQWELLAFPKPQISEHKRENTKIAVAEAKKVLSDVIQQFPDIKIVGRDNGKVQLIIPDPEAACDNGISLYEDILDLLHNSENVVFITVDVNNDISEKIATNKADYVPKPWHSGYKGMNHETVIHHK